MSGCCSGGSRRDNNDLEESAYSPVTKKDRSVGVDISQRAKVVFLGDAGVGKTSIVNRYVKDEFKVGETPTIGAAFAAKTHIISSSDKAIRFELWDTAGQERYHSLAPMYYRGCIAAIIVYDITAKKTFERAKEWLSELQRNCTSAVVLYLIGCKVDLTNQRQVDTAEASQFAQSCNCEFAEVSAKTGAHIQDLFEHVANLLWAKTKG